MKKRHRIRHICLTALTLAIGIFFLLSGKAQAADAIREIPGWVCPFNEINSATQLPRNCSIQVEQGNTVYLDSYLGAIHYSGDELFGAVGSGSRLKKAVYSSSQKSVATVGKNTGIVTTKKVGTTKITATYQKKKCICTLKVVKKGTFKSAAKYTKLKKAIHTLVKFNKTKITSENVRIMIQKGFDYDKLLRTAERLDVYSGFLKGEKRSNTTKLLLSEAPIADDVSTRLGEYCRDHDPVKNGKLKIVSIKGSVGSKEINLTLNRAATKTDIYILQYCYRWYLKKLSEKNVSFSNYYYDRGPGSSSPSKQGTCTITRGSKKATIKLNEKLKKDHTYEVKFRDGEEITFFPK